MPNNDAETRAPRIGKGIETLLISKIPDDKMEWHSSVLTTPESASDCTAHASGTGRVEPGVPATIKRESFQPPPRLTANLPPKAAMCRNDLSDAPFMRAIRIKMPKHPEKEHGVGNEQTFVFERFRIEFPLLVPLLVICTDR
eukprot:2513989-Amphidinium_carterae.1